MPLDSGARFAYTGTVLYLNLPPIQGGAMPKLPKQYLSIQKRYKNLIKAVENLGKAAKASGPLSKKSSELVQLAAAAAIRSEGSVHSHARRALKTGAKPDEVRHAIILLTSTIGFPAVSAALSWVEDVLEQK
jgi:4-carboxymuconolactone decarboxylase